MWWNSSKPGQSIPAFHVWASEFVCVCVSENGKHVQFCLIRAATTIKKMPCLALTTLLTHISSLDDFELLFTASCSMHTHGIGCWCSTIVIINIIIIVVVIMIINMPETKLITFHALQLKILVDVFGLFLFCFFFYLLRFKRKLFNRLHCGIIRALVCCFCSHFDNCFFSLSARCVFFIVAFYILCVSTLYWVKLFEPGLCLACTVWLRYIPWRKYVKKKMRCAKLTTIRKSKNKEMCSRMEMRRKEKKFWNCDFKSVCYTQNICSSSFGFGSLLLAAFVHNKRFLRISEYACYIECAT